MPSRRITLKAVLDHLHAMEVRIKQEIVEEMHAMEDRIDVRMNGKIEHLEARLTLQIDGIDQRLDAVEIEQMPKKIRGHEQRIRRLERRSRLVAV